MKILWSLNPFQDERPLQARCEAFLRSLGKIKESVEPVYVSSPAELQIALEFSVPLQERYRKVALQRVEGYLRKVKGLRLRPPRILEESSPELTEAAKALSLYAHRSKADLLVLGTHARGAISRFIMGSYAETFLPLSQTPLVLVNPKARVSKRLRKILFATDLSPASKKAFVACCRFAASVGASIILQNVIPRPVQWVTTRGYLLIGPEILTPDEYIKSLKKSRIDRAQSFLKIAKRAAVKATLHINDSSFRPADFILKTAKEVRADMIALVSQSSPLRGRLLGSVSREILRNSSFPVWMMNARR